MLQYRQTTSRQNKKDVPVDIMHYFSFQDELSTQDGLVFRGERVVIPESLQGDITKWIYSSHVGVEGCLRRAREVFLEEKGHFILKV